MDPERKTLADLSKEVKEKKYITLDTASKLSGYTIEYLERLCRLDKLEHRIIAKGGFAIELQSLLRETHTLLISDNEIDFVEQRELAPPVVEISTPESAPLVEPITLPVFRAPREPEPAPLVSPPVVEQPSAPASIYSEYGDEWDALLFGSVNEEPEAPVSPVAPVSLYNAPSVYRPVSTSVDPLLHQDVAPLFPVLNKSGVKKEEVAVPVVPVVAPVIAAPAPVLPQVPTPSAPASVLPQQITNNPVAPSLPAQVLPPLATAPVRVLTQAQPLTPVPSVAHLPEISPEHHLVIPESHALVEE